MSRSRAKEEKKIDLPVSFVARVRRRARVLEITMPARLMKELGIDHGTLVEIEIKKIVGHKKW
jgi:antitoxin component of MazEF toxin-antitoxin module